MRALKTWGVVMLLGAGGLTAQTEIFSDNLESGSTTNWSLDFSLCPQFFAGRSLSSHCYKWLQDSGDWFESQHQCSVWAPGGEMVSAETATEWNHLVFNMDPSSSDSWIGLSRGIRAACPGAWGWESGADLAFADWASGEPDEGACPACAASWSAFGHRWGDLPCDASGLVSDSICEVDLSAVRTVGSNGGRLVFPDGAILDVPAGAVDEKTAIAVRTMDCSELDSILNARPMNSHDKQCLAAVDILPADLALAQPATLAFPNLGRQSGEIPVLIEVFPEESDYAYRPTDLGHDPATGLLAVEISNPGMYAVVALTEPLLAPPANAPGRSTNALCEQGNINVQSEFVDLSVKDGDVECTLIFDSVSVTFLDCDGSPTFNHEMAEAVGCSDDTYFRGRICGPGVSGEECFNDPQPVTYVETEGTVLLQVWAEAIDPQQGNEPLFIANIDHATYQWQTLDYSMGSFPDPSTGLLQAKECPTETCQFGVQALNRYVSSPLPKGTVVVASVIFDVEWNYSWSGTRQCTQSGMGWSSDVREAHSGDWSGTATFVIPDYEVSAVMSWEVDGNIQYHRDFDVTESCEDPPRIAAWEGIDHQTWSSDTPCTPEDFNLHVNANEVDAIFVACIPWQRESYEFRSGMTCSGPLDVERTFWTDAVPCLFPTFVNLTNQGEGVFELDETLLLDLHCSWVWWPDPCTTKFPVSVFVRAVYRQTP